MYVCLSSVRNPGIQNVKIQHILYKEEVVALPSPPVVSVSSIMYQRGYTKTDLDLPAPTVPPFNGSRDDTPHSKRGMGENKILNVNNLEQLLNRAGLSNGKVTLKSKWLCVCDLTGNALLTFPKDAHTERGALYVIQTSFVQSVLAIS